MAKRTSVTLNFQKMYTDSVKERAALMEKNEKLLTINRDLLAALRDIDTTLSGRRKGKAMQALTIARTAIAEVKEVP